LPRTVPLHKQKPSQNVDVARAMSLGLTWALSTALFLYLGMLVDGWLDTKPVFTLVGAFVGAAAGFYYLYSQLMAGVGKNKRDRDIEK
jgi:F0F1-type ATP synthase assembly protein I